MIFHKLKIKLRQGNALVFRVYLPSVTHYVEKFWPCLSDYEQSQAKGFINNSLREKYISSHGILRYLLSFYANTKPQDIKYFFNPFGKPFLKNNLSIQFNMSHAKDYAVYIIALDSLVGIDIEWKDKENNLDDISEIVLNDQGLTFFRKLKDQEKLNAFYSIWTKKEAIIKAIGEGLSYPLKAINVLDSVKNQKVHSSYKTNEYEFYGSNLYDITDYASAVVLSRKSNVIQTELNLELFSQLLNKFIDSKRILSN